MQILIYSKREGQKAVRLPGQLQKTHITEVSIDLISQDGLKLENNSMQIKFPLTDL